MLTLSGIIGLVVYILVRPFDFFPALRAIPFLYIFFGLAVIGFAIDLARGSNKWTPGPHLPWVIGLVVWASLSMIIHSVSSLSEQFALLISPSLYFLVAHGVGDFRAFSKVASTFLLCILVVSAVCIYQGLQPLQCVQFPDDAPLGASGKPDGRDCKELADCMDPDDWETKYRCEKVGPGDLHSVDAGRVRYVGTLNDPNEAALAISLGMPIAIGRYQQRKSFRRLAVMCLTILLSITAVIMTQSRGGQLAFATVLGVYFVGRYRWKGLVIGALFALPVLLLGGRSDQSADESSSGRLEAQWAGIEMFRAHPLMGVGYGQFTDHHHATAHNSFVFAPAELGVVGMVAWGMLLWISLRVVLAGLKHSSQDEAGSEIHAWAYALLAILVGMAAGIAFLTFNYHYLLWIILGLSGAYYRNLIQQRPQAQLRLGWRDVALVTFGNLSFLALLFIYMRLRGVG